MIYGMEISGQQRDELQALLKSNAYNGSVSSRAQILLWHAEVRPKTEIAATLKTTRPTVDKRIKRYQDEGIEGLVNRTSPGGPRQIPDRIRARILALTKATRPTSWGYPIGRLFAAGFGNTAEHPSTEGEPCGSAVVSSSAARFAARVPRGR